MNDKYDEKAGTIAAAIFIIVMMLFFSEQIIGSAEAWMNLLLGL